MKKPKFIEPEINHTPLIFTKMGFKEVSKEDLLNDFNGAKTKNELIEYYIRYGKEIKVRFFVK